MDIGIVPIQPRQLSNLMGQSPLGEVSFDIVADIDRVLQIYPFEESWTIQQLTSELLMRNELQWALEDTARRQVRNKQWKIAGKTKDAIDASNQDRVRIINEIDLVFHNYSRNRRNFATQGDVIEHAAVSFGQLIDALTVLALRVRNGEEGDQTSRLRYLHLVEAFDELLKHLHLGDLVLPPGEIRKIYNQDERRN